MSDAPAEVPGAAAAPAPAPAASTPDPVNDALTPPAAPEDNGAAAPPPAASGGDDDWDLEVPEDKYVPRDLITEARNRYTNERLKRKEYESLLDEWGGRDTVKDAVEMHRHLQTEEGVIDLFIETGRALGLGADKLQQLFEAGQAAGMLPPGESGLESDDDDDRVMTLAEARALIESEVKQPQQQREYEQAVAQARSVVSSTLNDMGISEDIHMDILQLGDKHLPKGSLDPEAIRTAIQRGHAEWVELGEKAAKEYLSKKAAQANGVPKVATGGGAPAAPEVESPKSVDEAKARVREKLRALSS